MAGNLYDNGPEQLQSDGWLLNFGSAVSDTIQVTGTVQGLDFWGEISSSVDSISSVQVSIGTTAFSSNIFNGFVSLSQSNCSVNEYGFDVCLESANFSGPTLNGNYWLTLQNASVPSGDLAAWNENSGVGCMSFGCPSTAQQNEVGTIPSEAFTVLGAANTSTSTGTTPEPSSILLLGSGVLGAVGVLRRKIG